MITLRQVLRWGCTGEARAAKQVMRTSETDLERGRKTSSIEYFSSKARDERKRRLPVTPPAFSRDTGDMRDRTRRVSLEAGISVASRSVNLK
jgi:hypothetical protein